jgi:hypothetical protein
MDAMAIINRLERGGRAFPALVDGLTDDELRWKPASGAWSILEIVCHLGDEEVDDFRTRLFSTLEDPAKQWPGIDPEGWAGHRRYNETDAAAALARFVQERARSIELLRALKDPNWSLTHHHPKFGPIAAGDLLASWAAHDALHLRQVAKRLFELAGRDAGAFRTAYAGEWGP